VSLPVVLRDEASTEFDEAFDYYEAQRAGLGVDFVARVQQVFDRISANPFLHAVVLGEGGRAKKVSEPFLFSSGFPVSRTRVPVRPLAAKLSVHWLWTNGRRGRTNEYRPSTQLCL
jgi:hypothetical protein